MTTGLQYVRRQHGMKEPKLRMVRKMVGVTLVVLSLSCAAYAGDMQNDVAGNMPFPAPSAQAAPASSWPAEETEGGHIPNDVTAGGSVADSLLGLLLGVLSLL